MMSNNNENTVYVVRVSVEPVAHAHGHSSIAVEIGEPTGHPHDPWWRPLRVMHAQIENIVERYVLCHTHTGIKDRIIQAEMRHSNPGAVVDRCELPHGFTAYSTVARAVVIIDPSAPPIIAEWLRGKYKDKSTKESYMMEVENLWDAAREARSQEVQTFWESLPWCKRVWAAITRCIPYAYEGSNG